MLTEKTDQRWIFSTVDSFDTRYGEHPLWGSREFGFYKADNDKWRFYTVGVSRQADGAFALGDRIAFGYPAKDLAWDTLMSGFGHKLNKLNVNVGKMSSFSGSFNGEQFNLDFIKLNRAWK